MPKVPYHRDFVYSVGSYRKQFGKHGFTSMILVAVVIEVEDPSRNLQNCQKFTQVLIALSFRLTVEHILKGSRIVPYFVFFTEAAALKVF